MKLDVYSNGVIIGSLEQVDVADFVFTYNPNVQDDQCVSLLMLPSVKRTWRHRSLHPVFQVSLPEGVLRHVLTRSYAKQFEHFGDTELLSVVGAHLVGRNKVTASGTPLAQDAPTETLADMLQESTDQMLEHFLQVNAKYSGVSGGFTKYLAKSPASSGEGKRSTLAFDHWIVKSNDDEHPGLVFNEYHCMRVAQLMGLPTPRFYVSPDFSRLVIQRFDIDSNNHSLGFEDMCALNALDASQKFSGSVERVIKTINTFCQPAQAKVSREQFFAQYVACMALRNGDAHLKNFGIVYSSTHDAHIAPVYDMVSMSAYAPRHSCSSDARDEPAMSLNGVRRWPDQRALDYLAARCGITPTKRHDAIKALSDAMSAVADEMHLAAASHPPCKPLAGRMLELWGHGLRLHDPDRASRLTQLASETNSIETVRSTPEFALDTQPPIAAERVRG